MGKFMPRTSAGRLGQLQVESISTKPQTRHLRNHPHSTPGGARAATIPYRDTPYFNNTVPQCCTAITEPHRSPQGPLVPIPKKYCPPAIYTAVPQHAVPKYRKLP
ncbi:unnamed protein product, partial [Ectocarpus sp. 4 AP-2014]